MNVQEQYNAFRMTANATLGLAAGTQLAGLLCTTAGSMRLSLNSDGSGTDIVSVFAVTVGQFYNFPVNLGAPAALVLSGGAAGTLFAL